MINKFDVGDQLLHESALISVVWLLHIWTDSRSQLKRASNRLYFLVDRN